MDFIQIFKNLIYAMLIGGSHYLPISYSEKSGILNLLITVYDDGIIMLIKGMGIIGASIAVIFLYRTRFNPLKTGVNYFDIKLWRNIAFGSLPSMVAIILFKSKESYLLGVRNVNYIVIIIVAALFIITERLYKKNRIKGFKVIRIEKAPLKNVLILGIIQCVLFSLGISPVIGGMIGCWLIGVSTYSGVEYSLISSLCIYIINLVFSFLSLGNILLNSEVILTYLLVILVSFLMSLLTIDLLIALGKKKSLRIFAFINLLIGVIYLF